MREGILLGVKQTLVVWGSFLANSRYVFDGDVSTFHEQASWKYVAIFNRYDNEQVLFDDKMDTCDQFVVVSEVSLCELDFRTVRREPELLLIFKQFLDWELTSLFAIDEPWWDLSHPACPEIQRSCSQSSVCQVVLKTCQQWYVPNQNCGCQKISSHCAFQEVSKDVSIALAKTNHEGAVLNS